MQANPRLGLLLSDLRRDHSGLLSELRLRSARLGTPSELPDDMDQVVRLAHDLNNKATTLMMLNGLERMA